MLAILEGANYSGPGQPATEGKSSAHFNDPPTGIRHRISIQEVENERYVGSGSSADQRSTVDSLTTKILFDVGLPTPALDRLRGKNAALQYCYR